MKNFTEGKIFRKLREIIKYNDMVYEQTEIINLKRICILSVIAVPVSLIHIIVFLNTTVKNETELTWRNGIIISHSVLALVIGILGILCFYAIRKNIKRGMFTFVIQNITVLFTLFAGIAITAVDQLVTTNITPYLIVCTITSFMYLIRPAISLPLYITGYVFYYYALELTQLNEIVLMSNRVNGITLTGIAIGFSIVLWYSNATNLHQSLVIEKQKKELEDINSELSYLVSHDQMTGLYNRNEFMKKIISIGKKVKIVCLIILDIDHFKNINDKYGHPSGDQILRAFAEVLQYGSGESDIVARWGGEEFIVLLPGKDLEEGVEIAETLRKRIEEHKFRINGGNISVTASFGVADVICENEDSFIKAYEKADNALYKAKEAGRNRVIGNR